MGGILEQRLAASQASGGTSSSVIKRLVLRLLDRHEATGALLDFGAGRGELLALLASAERFHTLAGADLYPPPEELRERVTWHVVDLNEPLPITTPFDVVVCSEVIEHLENPRQTFRTLHAAIRPGGLLVLTMPNQQSIRSLLALVLRGHFVQFLDGCYPAHITSLLQMDLLRICKETGFAPVEFAWSDYGAVPRFTALSWQQLSLGLLRGRAFSDNLALVARALPTDDATD